MLARRYSDAAVPHVEATQGRAKRIAWITVLYYRETPYSLFFCEAGIFVERRKEGENIDAYSGV